MLSKGQGETLAAMKGCKLTLHKLDKRASVGELKVNLNTFFALKEKGLIVKDETTDAVALYRLTPAGESMADGQEEATTLV